MPKTKRIFKPELNTDVLAQEFVAHHRRMASRSHFGYRFGQHICEHYLAEGATCPNVFYATDPNAVFEEVYKIIHKYEENEDVG